MYIPDWSTEDYDKQDSPNRYSWGWLGDKVPREKRGWNDPQLKKKVIRHLKDLSSQDFTGGVIVLHHMGHHNCEICEAAKTKRERGSSFNGSLVITYKDREFRCPAGVEHYIEKHDYNPGEEVIEALFNGTYLTYEEEKKQWDKRIEEIHKKYPPSPIDPVGIAFHKKGQKKLAQLRRDGAVIGE